MNWDALVVPITREEIATHVVDESWQAVRLAMIYTSLEFKYETLVGWLKLNNNSRASAVQAANYVNALKRGGLIK